MQNYGSIPPMSSSVGQQATPVITAPTDPEPWRSKILVAGVRSSGKSSVLQAVFNSVPPSQTFYLETTTAVEKMNIDSIVALQFWDTPAGIYSQQDLEIPFSSFSSLIFVIDIQNEDYYNQIAHLVYLIAEIAESKAKINLEVFVHKAEAFSEEFKIERFQEIQSRTIEELMDHPKNSLLTDLPLNFFLTSVYDHTIYEAFSRVIQRLVTPLPALETLLNGLSANSGIAKAFLFDITSLVYVATDAPPVDNASFELCCDYVQTLVSFSNLYKNLRPKAGSDRPHSPTSSASSISQPQNGTSTSSRRNTLTVPADGEEEHDPFTASSSPSHSLISMAKSQGSNGSNAGTPPQGMLAITQGDQVGREPLDRLLAANSRWASSSVRLAPESTLSYWQITDTLSLVALIRTQTYEDHKGLIEYNVAFFRGAVQRIVQLEKARQI